MMIWDEDMTLLPIHGLNAGYVVELYERYQSQPEGLDVATRAFFQNWSPIMDDGAPVTAEVVADIRKVTGLANYVQAIRQFGHVAAQLDPLGTPPDRRPRVFAELSRVERGGLI